MVLLQVNGGFTMHPAIFWLLFAVLPNGEVRINVTPFPDAKLCEMTLADAAPEAAKLGAAQYCVPVSYPKLTGA